MSHPTLPPAVSRRLSRSNSTASSSASTVKQLGVKIRHRKSVSQARPPSSDSINEYISILDAASGPSFTASAPDRGRSPDLNINRWSHSTTSSIGAIDNDFLRQVSGNTATSRLTKPEPPAKQHIIPKSQYSRQPSESSLINPSPRKSPGRPQRPSRRSSPDASRLPYTSSNASGSRSNFTTTPDLDTATSRSNGNDYFDTSLVDYSRGVNKHDQQVVGVALTISSPNSRQRRLDQNRLGNGLYQATNSSHISLQKKPSHAKRRDRSANGSKDTATGGSMSSIASEKSQRGAHRSPTQKNMLSQALSKANQAVLYDNAQNMQGAIEAYHEACDILEQVMARSNDMEDRKKLSAIRSTYSTRIAELYDVDNSFAHLHTEKELPQAPVTTRYLDGQDRMSFDDSDDLRPSILLDEPQNSMHIPLRQESLLPQIYGGREYIEEQPPIAQREPSPLGKLNVPMDARYMPPPLSPRRPLSPSPVDEQPTRNAILRPADEAFSSTSHTRAQESVSWLDTFDDGPSSRGSSRRSSVDYVRDDKDLVSAIEAELDAAVDAAYDEDIPAEATPRPSDAAALVSGPDAEAPLQPQTSSEGMRTLATQPSQENILSNERYDYLTREYLDDDAEEEEELLEMMMAEGYMLDNQNQRPGAMSSLPRQSDSSGFSARSSGRTWDSSMTAATQGTTLSTLAEGPEMSLHQPPEVPEDGEDATLPHQDTNSLGHKQASPLPPLPTADKPSAVRLRDRRLSGQSARQLKIETFVRGGSVSQQGQSAEVPLLGLPAATEPRPELKHSASGTNISVNTMPITPLASIHSGNSMSESPETPELTKLLSNSTIGDEAPALIREDTKPMPPPLRKTTTSSSQRPRDLSLTTVNLDDVPATPGMFPTHSRHGTVSNSAMANASPNVLSSNAVGGMYIFDHIPDPVSPRSPRSPDFLRADPMPLEPCPQSFLLRPFWLMRCLYQTLAHPKGGYISTKLFVPRDIWRVKGVKIKAIDEKAGQCDVLTAALLKLAKVDTLDADAVLEELQSFDSIIDAVRLNLTKKLGSDVGLTGSVAAIKNSPAGEEQDAGAAKASSSVKSFTSSWRKLRSKSSSTTLPATTARKNGNPTEETMASLPMTSTTNVTTSRSYKTQRHPPPTPTGMPHIPPQHAAYMSSLARLFDAVQVLDSIARQVEDPGLKATSKTQVGLELSIRGAAEFFSFYVIRFAMADIATFLDKYLKRNSEWVML
ncbi:hypothetical protein LTR70_001928 [Exophiala xenobiotica]|uniref:MIT domain-containing protein n=1 Tax=Lithohypha guttulata TaxID=1690604 RepID=A0ABR0K9I5_9EURO|nr:hypothetical protein LTR24_005400 [Lithohypha guttulata]KAK5326913.1 hypothetical protein LTR70_001928 [Exophiala xenobiotica]